MDSWILVPIIIAVVIIVMTNFLAARKTGPVWRALAPAIGGRATGVGVSGAYAGRAVEARTYMAGGGPLSIYTFELTMAAGAAGQGSPWELTAAGGQWQVKSPDPSVGAGPLGAAIIDETSRWQAIHPDLPPGTRFDAARGRLVYKHENSQRIGQALTRTVSVGAELAQYPVPSPAQFAAQLELLNVLTAVTERFNGPSGIPSHAPE